MKRLNTPQFNEQLRSFASALAARQQLAARLGMQSYGGSRDIYQALGYPTTLRYSDFYARYRRQDIAKAVIDRPVKATWQGDLELIENQDAQYTPFEQAWRDLNTALGLKSILTRIDKLVRIGEYGVLVLGLDDVKSKEDWEKPVTVGKRKLLYVKPFSQESAKISSYISNPQNPKYGFPAFYDIEVSDVSNGSSQYIKVHHTRCLHIVEDNLESEVLGTPVLESVFNRLLDIEKIVGGDAEMFWRGARPGYQGIIDKDYTITPEEEKNIMNDVDEFEHNLRRIFLHEGVELKGLDVQISDPSPHVKTQLSMISAETGIPQRILAGSERGELASTQDAGEWKTYVQSRREDHVEPHIIRPFVSLLLKYSILPRPEGHYTIDWLDLFSISEKDRVEIGKGRASAIREYTTNPLAEALMPPRAFFELCLGLSTGQIELVEKMIAEGISDEQKDLIEEMTEIQQKNQPKPAALPTPGDPSKKTQLTKPTIKRTK